jgi:hypothetical protein
MALRPTGGEHRRYDGGGEVAYDSEGLELALALLNRERLQGIWVLSHGRERKGLGPLYSERVDDDGVIPELLNKPEQGCGDHLFRCLDTIYGE